MQINTQEVVTITNPFNTPIVAAIIKMIGHVITIKWSAYKGDPDDKYVDDMVLADGYQCRLMIANDNAWGAVTSVRMHGDHLILIANFGDDGDYSFSATLIDTDTDRQAIEVDGIGMVNRLIADDIIKYEPLVHPSISNPDTSFNYTSTSCGEKVSPSIKEFIEGMEQWNKETDGQIDFSFGNTTVQIAYLHYSNDDSDSTTMINMSELSFNSLHALKIYAGEVQELHPIDILDLDDVGISFTDIAAHPDMEKTWDKVKSFIGVTDDDQVACVAETDDQPEEMWEPDKYFISTDRTQSIDNLYSPNFAHGCVVFGCIEYQGRIINAIYTQDASPACILFKRI